MGEPTGGEGAGKPPGGSSERGDEACGGGGGGRGVCAEGGGRSWREGAEGGCPCECARAW